MTVLVDIGCLAVCPRDGAPGEIGEIQDAALVWEDGQIEWVGRRADLPSGYHDVKQESAGGNLVIPGLIDSHTHLVFGGERSGEFVERLRGTGYLDIARRGGGIQSTVRATREASEEQLVRRGTDRLKRMLKRGVTTVEAKSGYGLSLEAELKQLHAIRRLNEWSPQTVIPTFLGAHSVPPEFADDRSGYLALLIEEMIPQVAEADLAVFVDAFVEETAFSVDEARRYFEAARPYGFVPKLHADQLSDSGGALLAAEVGAASADHLEFISEDGIRAMAEKDVVAVSLPIATAVLGMPPLPARDLIDAGVRVAVATDFNPGSAPVDDLAQALWLACTLQRMTPAEVLQGATVHAAAALRLDDCGTLEPGARADFAVVNTTSVDAWLYDFRPDAFERTVIGGETVWTKV